MTPLITPDYMKPQTKPPDESSPSLARCPKTQWDVTAPLHYYNGEWWLCTACGEPHRVRINAKGERSLSCL